MATKVVTSESSCGCYTVGSVTVPCEAHRVKALNADLVPAPPTRTEEPEKLTCRLCNRADKHVENFGPQHHYVLAGEPTEGPDYIAHRTPEQCELVRLREQIETMREFFRMNRHEGFNYARHRFNDLFPPERP